jgi:hypothetical protein
MSTKTNIVADQETLENLIIAVLAVNNYPMSEALQLRPLLAENCITRLSIFDKEIPSSFQIKTIIMDAGYSRGDYMALLLGERIKSILEAIKTHGHTKFLKSLREGEEVASHMTGKLYGVGPKVVRNFVSLQYNSGGD